MLRVSDHHVSVFATKNIISNELACDYGDLYWEETERSNKKYITSKNRKTEIKTS